MEIGVASLKATSGSSPSQKNDSSAEIQKLEQQKKDIQQQLKQLEQGKQGGDAIKNAKEKLQKQLKEIEKQIQVLKQQGTEEVRPIADDAKVQPSRFDEYVKNDKQASGAGIYSKKKDENPEEKAALQKQLVNIETELRTKDNDAYRKQNASHTYSK